MELIVLPIIFLILTKISFNYPDGFASGGLSAYALASPTIPTSVEPGAPAGNVLFMLEFIAYKN